MTGVDPSTKYEKPRQDVGVFLLPHDFNFTLTLQDLMLWYISMIHILVSGGNYGNCESISNWSQSGCSLA